MDRPPEPHFPSRSAARKSISVSLRSSTGALPYELEIRQNSRWEGEISRYQTVGGRNISPAKIAPCAHVLRPIEAVPRRSLPRS